MDELFLAVLLKNVPPKWLPWLWLARWVLRIGLLIAGWEIFSHIKF